MAEGQKYIEKIRKKVGRSIYKYQLIEEGDHVLVALSGGKDSLVLLDCLAERRKAFPFHFDISAIHVDIENIPYTTDSKFLEEFCNIRDVKFHLKKLNIELDQQGVEEKGHCFICSWHRRKEVFNFSKNIECNKLAFGHHMDDALQTMLMNMMYHGSISSLPVKLKMFKGRLFLIRPLLYIPEEEIKDFARTMEFPGELKVCQYGENTKRVFAKQVLDRLDKNYINAKKNMFRSMDNIYTEYLPKK